ncbi:DUF2971 domain-containing protein [uncultured Treponema sp.]|uniref:DUF2971 domain-containing protein n=1 Tax=uncultured Treponema sp. TaxID=162155 RepID=UPI0025E127E5|nr:DUF2971 domain-containing protein [uncultured Treponema sp.]
MIFRKFCPMKLYVLDNIIKEQLTLSNPNNFNDVFDCALLRDNDFLKNLKYEERCYISNLKVLCLFDVSNKLDNYDEIKRYFWSFYGDSHRGICIEFSIPDEEFKNTTSNGILKVTNEIQTISLNVNCFAGNVEYRNDIINNISTLKNTVNRTDFFQIIKNGAFLKDSIFSRENEFRIFKVCDNKEALDFFPIENFSQKKIIFGRECKDSFKKLIFNSVGNKYKIYFVNDKMEEKIYEFK